MCLIEFICTTPVWVPKEAKGHQVTWNWSYKQLVINHLMLMLESESSERAIHAFKSLSHHRSKIFALVF